MSLPFSIFLGATGSIALIWLGYPLIMWGVSRLAGRPNVPDAERGRTRQVSVILATRDSASTVHARVANLLDTAHPAANLEVIVALDAEGAATTVGEMMDALRAFGRRARVIAGDAPGGKASALNAGVRAAIGDILVMADAQQRFDRQTIPALVASLEDLRFGAVSGALTLGGTGSPVHYYWALEKWLRASEARLHSAIGVTGAVYATRRALWPVLPAGTLLDDVYVPMSLVLRGHRVGFTFDARAIDVRAFDEQGEARRKTRTLTGVLQLRALLPSIMSPRRNPVWMQWVAHKLLRLATPYLVLVSAVSGAIAFVGLLAGASRTLQLIVAALAVLPLAIPAVRRRVLSTMRWGVAMQGAAARASVNGMRSRWQVWGR